ncbi:MAG: hypothetical protein RJA70_1126 [Pseudomonadota bacterium]|jgi:arginine N-succinyltransferase
MPTQQVRYEIRAALPSDHDALLALAQHLNSVNLPADSAAVSRLLQRSAESFQGDALPEPKRKYVFLLYDNQERRAVGTSTIVAQLGSRDAPYIYFDVFTEEKYSRDLNLHFEHEALRIGFSYDGPTELGGLVVDPAYRRAPERLGLCISYVRFLFIAARRAAFQEQLLAELLPPLEADGTSHLWNALGRRFTNMSYREADRLSHENKDFIRDLFPSAPVYASLLDEAARSVIGQVGEQTRGVEKMLRRVGFYYGNRVDPFDGGPHFFAETGQVTLVQRYRALPVQAVSEPPQSRGLVARFYDESPYFRALPADLYMGEEQLGVSADVLSALDVQSGDVLHAIPTP